MSRRVGLALLIAFWAGWAQGAMWIVCPVDCPYASLGEAIAAAAPGDTILVRPGAYTGDLWLKQPLSLRGEGDEPVVIQGNVYVLGTTQVTMHGLTVRGGIYIEDSSGVLVADSVVDGPAGIVVRSASATLRGLAVTGAAGHGILVTLGSRVLIAGCTVSGSQLDGIHIAASMADIRDTTVRDSGGYGIWADGHATVTGRATIESIVGNAAGTLSSAARLLDRDPPAAPTRLAVSPETWTAGPITISWAAPEDLSGIAAVWYKIGTAPLGPADGVRASGNPFVIGSPPEGRHAVYVWLEDHAGNRNERAFAEATLLADRTPPTGRIAGNNGARHAFATEIALEIEATDLAGTEPGSGVTSLRLSNDGRTWSPWQPFANRVSWDLARWGGSAAPGTRTVFVEMKDGAGNVGRSSAERTLVQSLAAPEPVLGLAVTASGKRLAQGLLGGGIRLLDPRTGREVQVLAGHTGGVYSVAFSPDERTLVSGSSDNTVRLWEIVARRDPRILRGHRGGVWAVAFAPTGRTVASGSSDTTVRLWDAATGRAVRTLEGHTKPVRSVAFSPDGKLLASGGDDRSVLVWDVRTGRVRHRLAEHTGAVRSVAFSPDGKLLASVGLDGKVLLWDMDIGQLARTIADLDIGLRAVAFSPDGKSIAAASAAGVIVVWDVATAREREAFTAHTAEINALVYVADGRTLASGGSDNVVRLWEVGPQD